MIPKGQSNAISSYYQYYYCNIELETIPLLVDNCSGFWVPTTVSCYDFLQGVSVAVSPVLAIVGKPSVCPSVCPSHAGTE